MKKYLDFIDDKLKEYRETPYDEILVVLLECRDKYEELLMEAEIEDGM